MELEQRHPHRRHNRGGHAGSVEPVVQAAVRKKMTNGLFGMADNGALQSWLGIAEAEVHRDSGIAPGASSG